jgi:hypothetical protein
LARHSEITTTLKYYTTIDAAGIAEELWSNFGPQAGLYNTSYNSGPKTAKNQNGQNRRKSIPGKGSRGGNRTRTSVMDTGF